MLIRLANAELDAIIDDDDFDLVRGYKWTINGIAPHLYVIAWHDSTYTLMHRLVTGAGHGDKVDHRDHNTLNNQKANLRICAHYENMANRKMSKANKVGVRGVYLDSRQVKNPYRAEVCKFGKKVRKSFPSIEEAGAWVAKVSKEIHGDFVCLDGCPKPTASLSG
jgi:hypothetical protein